MLTKPPDMIPYLGKTIDKICSRSIVAKKGAFHCAHFVSHVMEYDSFPTTCKNQLDADKLLPGKGAAIRVNEIFNVVPEYGRWADRPLHLTSCLIFVTNSGNLNPGGHRLTMKDGEKKHVGIYHDGAVWHYSGAGKVEKDQVLLFIKKFEHAYTTAGQTVDFFYGRFLK